MSDDAANISRVQCAHWKHASTAAAAALVACRSSRWPGPARLGTADLDGAQTNTIQREKRADRAHQLGDSHLLDEEEGQWSQWEGEEWKVPSWKNIVVTVNLVLFGTRLNQRSQWLDRVWFLPSQIFVPKHDQFN